MKSFYEKLKVKIQKLFLKFIVNKMESYEGIEIDWDILDELLKEKKIKNVQVFLNAIYPHIYHLINSCQFFETNQKANLFENLNQQKINELLNSVDAIKEYEFTNSSLLNFDPL